MLLHVRPLVGRQRPVEQVTEHPAHPLVGPLGHPDAAKARRNVVLPSGLDASQQERYFRTASHRYRVYWDALQLEYDVSA